jgi:alkylation response protein AidB-like acyl-CoA dehydrogenase
MTEHRRAVGLGAATRLAPRFAGRADAHDRDGTFPAEDFADLRDAGLMGLMVPERLGGLGASFADYVEVAMTLARGNAATALVFNMHTSITGAMALTRDDLPLALGVPDEYFERRDEWLRAAAKGSFYAVAMSERGAGSRLSQLATAYEREDGGWRIRGTKTFCSGAGHADSYLVAARNAAGEVSQFLVPAGDHAQGGITVEQTWDSLGMRATGSHDLHLDVRVPDEALIGGVEGLGLLLAQAMPQWLVASYSAVYAGVGLAAVDAGVDYIRQRGLEKLPSVRARIGRADAQAHAAAQVVREAAARVDADPGGAETNRWVWRAKLLAGDTAVAVASSVLEACGTAATRRGSALERLYRDARCGALQPATSDVCADWLGCASLGLDPDRDGEVARW